jgi:hypothetical protein
MTARFLIAGAVCFGALAAVLVYLFWAVDHGHITLP